jgi:hypothetical protein
MTYVWIALRVIGVALLLFLAFTGVKGGIDQVSGMHTAAQRIQTVLQLAMGITSALAVYVSFRAERWRRAAYVAFVLSCTLAGGLAPSAWGGQGLWPSVGAAVASLLVAALIVWLAHPRTAAAP